MLMSPREVLAAIHRGRNAIVNVEGPHGYLEIEEGEERKTWRTLASETASGLFTNKVIARFIVGEQIYFSLASVYPGSRHEYTSPVTGLRVFSREELRYLNCIAVDVDIAHDTGEVLDFDSQVQRALNFTVLAGLPFPSMVSNSGRGIWLFWLLKDRLYPDQPLGAWRNLQLIHSRLLNAAVGAYRRFNAGADYACTDSQRVARFPGSINAKSGTVVQYFKTSDRIFTLPELADGFGVKAQKTAITKQKERIIECTGRTDYKSGGQRFDDSGRLKKAVCLTIKARAGNARWRSPLAGLRQLAEIRGTFRKGHRRKAVHLFASVAKRARLANLHSEATCFARTHCPTLKPNEIQKCLNAARKNWRHISNCKIIDMLKISESEQKRLTYWLRPMKPTKAAEIAFRRSVLAAELELRGTLSIRTAVYAYGSRGIAVGRSQVAEDLKYVKANKAQQLAVVMPAAPPILVRGENKEKESGFPCLSVEGASKGPLQVQAGKTGQPCGECEITTGAERTAHFHGRRGQAVAAPKVKQPTRKKSP